MSQGFMTGIYSHHLAALIQALCRYLHMPTVPLIKPRVFFWQVLTINQIIKVSVRLLTLVRGLEFRVVGGKQTVQQAQTVS